MGSIIGLVGHGGSGRTTIATAIQHMRAGVRMPVGHSLNILGSDEVAYRLRYTDAGREVLRGHVEDSWKRAVNGLHHQFILAEDVTTASEAAAVRAVGGVIVRLYRPATDYDVDRDAPHEREIPFIEADHSIWNDEDLTTLHTRTSALLDNLHWPVSPFANNADNGGWATGGLNGAQGMGYQPTSQHLQQAMINQQMAHQAKYAQSMQQAMQQATYQPTSAANPYANAGQTSAAPSGPLSSILGGPSLPGGLLGRRP